MDNLFDGVDLSTLPAASDGAQNDHGVGGPGAYRLKRFIAIPIMEETAHPEKGEFALSPVELSQGKFSAHKKYLLCGRFRGQFVVADREDLESALAGEAQSRLGLLAAEATAWLTGTLIERGVNEAPALITDFLRRMLGLR